MDETTACGLRRDVSAALKASALLTDSAYDIQIVSTANRPISALVRDGLFLEALYYRVNVVLFERGKETDQYTL